MIQVYLLLLWGSLTLCVEGHSRYVGCSQMKEPGPCFGYFPKYYFDTKENRCKQFIYGGCQGNKNRFHTQERCSRACEARPTTKIKTGPKKVKNNNLPKKCLLEEDSGHCFGFLRMYYYNANEGRCKMFRYGGCGGNLNRFISIHRCEKTCRGKRTKVRSLSPCMIKPETGPCRAYFIRYYYDYKLRRCKRFVFGGCLGNANNFRTKKECEQRCRK